MCVDLSGVSRSFLQKYENRRVLFHIYTGVTNTYTKIFVYICINIYVPLCRQGGD